MKNLKILFILFIFLIYGFSAIAQEYPVEWGATEGLAKTSTNTLEPGDQGWLKFSVDLSNLNGEEAENYYFMIGFHEEEDPTTYQELDYGLLINQSDIYIIEEGQMQAYLGRVSEGEVDVLTIMREGSTILFLKNDDELGILETNGSEALYILGASLQDVDVLPPITTSAPPPSPTPPPIENRNWVHTKVYDGDGTTDQHLVSDARTYFDELGRVTQQQAKSFTNDEVLAVQPMYDVYGRAVGQTLSAPIGSNQIGFKDNFLTNGSGNAYTFMDFDKPTTFSGGNTGTADNPTPVGNQSNTVGWYYSNQNTKEAYVATTGYPYGWTKSTPDGSAVRSSGVGDHHRMGSGEEARVYSFSPSTELEYLYGYARSYEADPSSTALDPVSKHLNRQLKAYKTVSIGEDGVEYISFSSASGLHLASAVSGAPTTDNHCIGQKAAYTLYGKGDRSANVHIPAAKKGTVTLDLSDPIFNGKFDLKITDLNTYELLVQGTDYNLSDLSGSSGQVQQITFLGNHATASGFYKVSFEMTDLSGGEPNKFTVTTETDYSNWTLMYYNQWGQLIKSVSPQGIDCSYDASTYHNPVQPSLPGGYLNTVGAYYNNWTPNSTVNMREWTLPTIQDPTIDHRKLSVTIDVDGFMAYTGNSQPPVNQWAQGDPYHEEQGDYNNMIIGYELTMGFFGVVNGSGTETLLEQEVIVADIALENNGGTWEAFVINPSQWSYEWDDNTLNGFDKVVVRTLDIKVGFSQGNYNQVYDPTDIVQIEYINHIDFPYFYQSEVYQGNEIPHTMATVYHYDDEGQLVAEKSDDEGLTEYIYDDEGKLRFAQDAKQRANSRYAYIIYDNRGRIVETGEADETTVDFTTGYYNLNNSILTDAYFHRNDDEGTSLPVADRHNRTYVLYDDTDGATLPTGYQQNYLGGRISKTWNDRNTTYYSYNHRGELTFTAQDIEHLGWKTMDYTYDYFGRLIKKTYQKGQTEEFEYLYTYDRDGRMVRLETDNGNIIQHAEYEFYLHGPLKRTELGDQLQGIDYVYTITGALKSINHPNIGRTNTDNNNKGFDPGQDGFTGTNSGFAKDAFGMTIDYYGGDYKRSGTFINTGASTGAALPQEHRDGRIKGIRWNTQGANQLGGLSQNMWSYDYDWKQQLTTATFGFYRKNNTTNSHGQEVYYPDDGTGLVPGKFNASNDYKVHGITYDRNGNILTLKRNDKDGILMDDLQYVYENITNGYAKNTNKLRHVVDAVGFKGYDDVHTQIQDNYQYTETGEIELDKEKQIKIAYHVNGKVEEVRDEQTNRLKVTYTYNERAERMTKNHYQYDPVDQKNYLIKTTYYVREVSGAVISIYEEEIDAPISQEIPIAGIGVYYAEINQFVYQLTDHLGNVRATIKDTKLNGEAEVLSYADYYPFGMTMAGRHGASSPQYRLAYQGQELDAEFGGSGFYAFELRNYDPRLGKWLSPDPYQQHWSPYLAMSNNPVSFIDPDGGRDYEWYNGSGASNTNRIADQMNADHLWDERMNAWESMTYVVDGMVVNSLEFVNTFNSGEYSDFYITGNLVAGETIEELGIIKNVYTQLQVQTFVDGIILFDVFAGYSFDRSGLSRLGDPWTTDQLLTAARRYETYRNIESNMTSNWIINNRPMNEIGQHPNLKGVTNNEKHFTNINPNLSLEEAIVYLTYEITHALNDSKLDLLDKKAKNGEITIYEYVFGKMESEAEANFNGMKIAESMGKTEEYFGQIRTAIYRDFVNGNKTKEEVLNSLIFWLMQYGRVEGRGFVYHEYVKQAKVLGASYATKKQWVEFSRKYGIDIHDRNKALLHLVPDYYIIDPPTNSIIINPKYEN